MERETLVALTADIVSAYVSNNSADIRSLPECIANVYDALATAGEPAQAAAAEEQLSPAVSVRSSVKPDAIICLECGFKAKMLKRHLGAEHNLTPQEYKARWGLAKDYPLVAPNYAAMRKEIAQKIGLGRKAGQKVARRKSKA